ncbi:hypothetical protein DFP72DRAFT_852903 [Ephemerocybe angulata]|uniref:Uncharacterized protein n=1 Tax=Ephemerocybe angulata TaxID=980116 RepID=A0A8H6HNK2_9AGAR|nr:hypothetical protein DFP72DRAFT_852903 [Tulosesus angulatus]
MKFSATLAFLSCAALIAAAPTFTSVHARQDANGYEDLNPYLSPNDLDGGAARWEKDGNQDLTPSFGPARTDVAGCPPPRSKFYDALSLGVANGKAVFGPGYDMHWPIGNSNWAKMERLRSSVIAINNFPGFGQGGVEHCPISTTTILDQIRELGYDPAYIDLAPELRT